MHGLTYLAGSHFVGQYKYLVARLQILLKLQAAIPVAPQDDGIVAISVQIAQVSYCLIVVHQMLPPF